LVSLILGGVSSSKFVKFFVAVLVHLDATLQSRDGFWEIETCVISPRPSLFTLLQENFIWRCSKIRIWFQAYTQRKTTHVQSSLWRCQKIQSNNSTCGC
jgi:hypothetical protein